MKKISRILCLLLTILMVFSMISLSPVWAQEASEPESTIAEVTEPATETLLDDSILFSPRATYENGKYRPKAVVWNCNYEKISYSYNGINYSSDRVLLNSVWIDGAFQTAYCIEPGRNIQSGSIYDDTEYAGGDPWTLLDYSKQRGVSLAILYGYPNGIDSDDLKTQIAYQLATSLIIHEIILGWREDTHPFARLNDAYYDVFGGGTPEKPEKLQITSEYYSSVHTKFLNNEDVWFAYNYISDCLATHDLIPSFASKQEEFAPSYTMEANGDGTYSITLTDSNSILSAYEFTDTENLTFTKSADGQSLTITTTGSDVGSLVVVPERIVPNSEQSAFLIWDAATGSQDMCTLHSPKYDPVPAFFKLKLPNGKVHIKKATSDNQNKSGWLFEIYSDEECTNLVSGPHSTDPGGNVVLSNFPAGTYWVKETGNKSETINELYYCEEDVKQVVVSSGETTTVNFMNILVPKGSLEIRKTTDTGTNVMGWQFALYAEESCETMLYGPVATDPTGIAKFTELPLGTYWLKEIGNNEGEMVEIYTCMSRNPQPVAITSEETVQVAFYNKLKTCGITIRKTDPYDIPLSGVHFLLEYSTDETNWMPVTSATAPGIGHCMSPGLQDGILVTEDSGNVSFIGLHPNLYYRLTEVQAPNGYQLLEGPVFEGKLTVDDTMVTFQVVNTPVFTLPHTGSRSMIGMSAGLALCLLTCIGAVIYLKKKE